MKRKGHELKYQNGIYTLSIDGEFIIESEDLEYVLSYFNVKGKENENGNESKSEVYQV